jgi:hypothetical protein
VARSSRGRLDPRPVHVFAGRDFDPSADFGPRSGACRSRRVYHTYAQWIMWGGFVELFRGVDVMAHELLLTSIVCLGLREGMMCASRMIQYFNEPGFQNSQGTASGRKASAEYNAEVRLRTLQWAMVDALQHPMPHFEDIIRTHFRLHKPKVLGQAREWVRIASAAYRPEITAAFEALESLMKDF